MRTFSLAYYVRKSLTKQNESCRLFARITVDGKRVDFSLNRKINPQSWNHFASKPKTNRAGDRELSRYLASVEELFFKIERELIEKSIPVTPKNLMDEYQKKVSGKSTVNAHSLFSVFDAHNQQMAELLGVGSVVKSTVSKYIATKRHLSEFIEMKFDKNDLLLTELTLSFVYDFHHWLCTHKKCAHNTIIKYIKNLKKIIRIAIDHGYLLSDPFRLYKEKSKSAARGYLSIEEVRKIEQINISIFRLEKVRKIFLFSCYTGLSCSDLSTLSVNNIEKDKEGNRWIIKPRQKTKVISRIFVLPAAGQIIDEYINDPLSQKNGTIFPPISNQRLNSYLKEIADLAGIDKKITFHMARHTFATSITLANGVSLESVSAQLGHTNIRQTQHYARMVASRIGSEMKLLAGIFK